MVYSTKCILSAVVLAVLVVLLVAQQTTAAPSGGTCHFTTEQWREIVFRMCRGRLKKRSVGSSMINAIQDIQLLTKIDALTDSQGKPRVKRSDYPLHLLVSYCVENCCSYDLVENICS